MSPVCGKYQLDHDAIQGRFDGTELTEGGLDLKEADVVPDLGIDQPLGKVVGRPKQAARRAKAKVAT